jgi:hypothetical protein
MPGIEAGDSLDRPSYSIDRNLERDIAVLVGPISVTGGASVA